MTDPQRGDMITVASDLDPARPTAVCADVLALIAERGRLVAELAGLRAQRDALVAQAADGIQECDNCGEERLTAWLDESGDVECIQCSAGERDRLWHRWDELRAQRDAALARLDRAVAEQERQAAAATAKDADSPAASSVRGQAYGVRYARALVRAALGVQPEGS